jgi:glycosyltransferase involved in cell wall biosynthesis
MLEAMSTGLPCVATDVGGVAAALSTGGGIVVPRQDPESLAGALSRFIRDERLRKQTGEAARKSATARFDREVMLQEYERILLAGS